MSTTHRQRTLKSLTSQEGESTQRSPAEGDNKESEIFKKFHAKLQNLNQTVFSPELDPQFFVYMTRLAEAEKVAETDRIDGRKALNDFVESPDSLVFYKAWKEAEKVK